MKEKMTNILIGAAMLMAAAFFCFIMEDFVFYVSFIPLNNVVVSIVAAVIGILFLLVGLFEKKDKENK